jgi:glycosyltransferase involved in cell wall biosynthesis
VTAGTVLCTAGAALTGYVLAGYPLCLGLMARLSARREVREFRAKSVTVLLAVHNGERYIERKLDTLQALDYPSDLLAIFVLSDGSTDRTNELVRARAAKDPRIRLFELPRSGKSGALSVGIQEAKSDLLFSTDVRQELEPSSLRRLVERLADETVGVVSGELVLIDRGSRELKSVGLYWKYEKWIRFRQSELGSMLGATGAIYLIRRNLAREMPASIILDDVFQPLCAYFGGFRVVIEGGAIAYDEAVPLTNEFRRKVRTQAGVYQILRAFPELLLPWTRGWFHFWSHKMGRLMLPFALAAVAIGSLLLDSPYREVLVAAQVGGYGLAGMDGMVGEKSPLKKLTSPIRTFVVLVAAAAVAIRAVFQPVDRVWR